jgi:trk system potassium uptake protein TrkH
LEFAGDDPIRLIEMGGVAKAIFAAAMVLGRLETLAIIALFTRDLWRG